MKKPEIKLTKNQNLKYVKRLRDTDRMSEIKK